MSKNKFIFRLLVISSVAYAGMGLAHSADAPPNPVEKTEAPGSNHSDSTLTTQVKTALVTNNLPSIAVTTELGVVALSGYVPTYELRQQAAKIAASIDGVRGVDYTRLGIKAGL